MKIDGIYIGGYRHHLPLTRACVASIRRWYPDVPIHLIKDYSAGPYSTTELEKYWNVDVLETEIRQFGSALWKFEPMLLKRRERCLILDSDIVFMGKVLDVLETKEEDFVVERRSAAADEVERHYYSLGKLQEIDPEFVYPGFVFNSGHVVATTGIFMREDLEPFVTAGEWPKKIRPDIFRGADQGLLNYLMAKKLSKGEISLARVDFMRWGYSPTFRMGQQFDEPNMSYPFLVHWAGPKEPFFHQMATGHLLQYYEKCYYTQIPLGRFRQLIRCLGRYMRSCRVSRT